ncbi:MAG: alpha/beta hydrolase family protein, partial [Planctomycetales bacterium]|nr:alpha/beta hydrolase family protein [Planctomycetales bacterium]
MNDPKQRHHAANVSRAFCNVIPTDRVRCVALLAAVMFTAGACADEPSTPERQATSSDAALTGTIVFKPTTKEPNVAERFQLAAHEFDFQQQETVRVGQSYSVSHVTFPSPVTTKHEANNTVHCEYFRPLSGDRDGNDDAASAVNGKPVPGVVVLHILGGDFPLARMFCMRFASHGVAALFVKMPYYGPRRTPGEPARMVSSDPKQTVRGMTQAVLDVRRAVAWLGAQEEIDGERLGVFGISLGGITASLAATAEPRIVKVCPVLAGGDIGQVAWQSPELAKYRDRWKSEGYTQNSVVALMRQIDPVTYAGGVAGKKILMINATADEVIPRRCTESLWVAFGKPPIVWFDGGHYSAAFHILDCLRLSSEFFAA